MSSRTQFESVVLAAVSLVCATGCAVAAATSDDPSPPAAKGGSSGTVLPSRLTGIGKMAAAGPSLGATHGQGQSSSPGLSSFSPVSQQNTEGFNSAYICDGLQPVVLARDTAISINGTTDGVANGFQSWCGANSTAGAAVIAFTLAESGSFKLTVNPANGSALQPVTDLRTDCSQVWGCGTDGEIYDDFAAGTYYLIVNGDNGTSGDFVVTLSLSTPYCGDGVVNVNSGEQCDPGAAVSNDGCGAPGQATACQFLPAPAGEDQCPGQLVAVPAGTTVLAAADGNSTYGFRDDYAGSCGGGPGDGTGGADRVYQLVPAASGTMTVSIGYEPDGVTSICAASLWDPYCLATALYVRTSCDDTTTEVACASSYYNPFQAWSLTFPVTAGTPYYVFVDGYDALPYSAGLFNLVISLGDGSGSQSLPSGMFSAPDGGQ